MIVVIGESVDVDISRPFTFHITKASHPPCRFKSDAKRNEAAARMAIAENAPENSRFEESLSRGNSSGARSVSQNAAIRKHRAPSVKARVTRAESLNNKTTKNRVPAIAKPTVAPSAMCRSIGVPRHSLL